MNNFWLAVGEGMVIGGALLAFIILLTKYLINRPKLEYEIRKAVLADLIVSHPAAARQVVATYEEPIAGYKSGDLDFLDQATRDL